MMIDIDSLTVKEIREISALARCGKAAPASALPFKIGDAILIRTVTHYQVGRVTAIGRDSITLEDASWIADSGRFSDALSKGTFSEVEKAPSWICVGRGAIVDIYPWSHALPTATK